MTFLPLRLLLLFTLALAGPAVSQPQADTALNPAMAAVRAQLDAGTVSGLRLPRISAVSKAVTQAYERALWRPLWTNARGPTAAALATIRFLAHSDSLGLEPVEYDVARLDSMAAALAAAPREDGDPAFEVTMSVATARMLTALRWGRARQPQAYPRSWRSRDDFELDAGIYATSLGPDPAVVFEQAGPQWAPYKELLKALPQVRRWAADSAIQRDAPVARAVGRPLKTAPQVRRLLMALGIGADSAAPALEADTLLDRSLSRALSQLQREVGLARTGVFDARTRDSLRAAFRNRERSAVFSLERWRWIPRGADRRAIIVNIPEYRLHAYDSANSGAPGFSMNVVVGKGEEDRYTPLFFDEMEHIIFSPYWEVPQGIAKEEIVPKLREDPTYLSRNRYVLARGYAENPPTIRADSAAIAGIGRTVRVRQLPGDYNSLGRVKFMLPNNLNIYLHDTNEKHLFKRTVRAFSHGCVRVSEPQRLAQWVLAGDTAWSPDRMQKAMKAKEPELVKLSESIPVLLVYHTAAVDSRGILRLFKDVYEYDEPLAAVLARGGGTVPTTPKPAATPASAPATR